MSPAFFGWWKLARQHRGFPGQDSFFGGPFGGWDNVPFGNPGRRGPRPWRGGPDESRDAVESGTDRHSAGGPDGSGGGHDRRDDFEGHRRWAGHGGPGGHGGHGCGPGGGWGPGWGNRFGGGGPGGGPGGGGGDDDFGNGFGVRRPLRFLAWKLELEENQIAELAAIIDDLKTERAQAAVDLRRTTSALADAIGASELDEAKITEATNARVKATERLQSSVAKALSKIHQILDDEQRKRLSYLIRTGVISM